jgi:hypothetical protein
MSFYWHIWHLRVLAAVYHFDPVQLGIVLLSWQCSWKDSRHGWEIRTNEYEGWRSGIKVRIWRGKETEVVSLQQPIVIRRGI